MWDRLIAAGEQFDITPYGTETMHVLRAEKGYPIIGQDTDGTVTPQDLGMDWVVSKKKPDFIGKRSFTRAENLSPMRKQFVGLLPLDRETVLPEGAQIIEPVAGGVLPPPPVPMLGHVTSSYRSAELGRPFGLALIKEAGLVSVTPCTSPWTARWWRSRSPIPSSSIQKEHAAMTETLTVISSLQGWIEISPLPATVTLREEPSVAMVDLWADPDGPAASQASAILGLDLPTTPSTYVINDTLTVIWMGP